MSKGFVFRALIGVVFAAASFAAAVIVHASERASADAELEAVANEFVALLDADRPDAALRLMPTATTLATDAASFRRVIGSQRASLGAKRCRGDARMDFGTSAESARTVRFHTEFETRAATELVHLQRGTDGRWRVASYAVTAAFPLMHCDPVHG